MLSYFIFHAFLYHAADGPGSVLRIEPLLCKEEDNILVCVQRVALLFQTFFETGEVQLHDLADVFLVECVEDNGVVNAVEELRSQIVLEFLDDFCAFFLVGVIVFPGFVLELESYLPCLLCEFCCTDIARHDDNRIREVHLLSLAICEYAVFQNLQENVEEFRMRLLDFVEENNRVGFATHRFRKLPALLISHVSCRCSYEARDVVALHELRHIDLDEGIFTVEYFLCDCAHEFSFSHAGRAEEEERANGPALITNANA